ncbi:MAG: hypothetical protein O6768_07100 [Planctomycetota bacterium]|nr:hypothetical protein [Planctomycetota bacterium]
MSAAMMHRVVVWKLAVVFAFTTTLGIPCLVAAESDQDAPPKKIRLGAGDALGRTLPAATAQPAREFPYIAAVAANEVYVRAGADVKYYPFGKVGKNDLVKIIGEKNGWARAVTLGPAFGNFFAYIVYPKSQVGRLRLSADGRTGSTTEPTDLFAPNLHAGNDPDKSWKPIIKVAADRTLRVRGTMETEGELVYKVSLPADAEGWINLTHLRQVTPAEAAAWEAPLAKSGRAKQPAQKGDEVVAVRPSTQSPVGRERSNARQTGTQDTWTRLPSARGATPKTRSARSAPTRNTSQSAELRQAKIVLDDLEAAYYRLLAEPIETAEVGPLRQLYLDLAQQHRNNRSIAEYSEVRGRQLQLWSEIQQHKLELARLGDQARLTAEEAETAREVLEVAGTYVATGRLEASIIYDGDRLPLLLRLRDPATGRTIAYLQPDERLGLTDMLGQLIGIVGEESYDGGLRLNLVHPRRIDVLAPRSL